MRHSLTLRLPVDALIAAPTPALVRLARAMELPVTRLGGESEGAYRGRLRHAIQRAEGAAKAGRRWLVEKSDARKRYKTRPLRTICMGLEDGGLRAEATARRVSLVDAMNAETNRGESREIHRKQHHERRAVHRRGPHGRGRGREGRRGVG